MYSKLRLALCLSAALAALPFSGCSLRLKGPEAQQELLRVTPGGGCLSKTGAVLDRYHKGTLNEADHTAFFQCVHSAFTTFSEYADGKNEDSFSPQELSNFFTKYFLNGRQVPPSLQAEMMALKQALIGGASDHLTRQDLRRLMYIVDVLKGVTGTLRPYMPFDAASFAERHFDPDQFNEAMKAFLEASATFGKEVQGSQGSYPLDHVASLARELRSFLYNDDPPPNNWTDSMLKYAEVVRPAKSILVSPPRDVIQPSDWPKIYKLAPRYFALFSRAQFYLATPVSYFYGTGLSRVESFYEEFQELFRTALAAQPTQSITSAQIDDLLKTLETAKLLPIPATDANSYLRVLFGRILGTSGTGKDFSINKNSLSRLDENLRYALEGLHADEALFRAQLGDSDFLNHGLTRKEISAVPTATLVNATTLKNGLSLEAAEAVKRSAFEIGTVFQRNSQEVLIPKAGQSSQYTHSHLAKIHLLRSVNRLLVQAYGSRKSGNRLTDAQIKRLLDEVFPILEGFQLVDSSMRASVKKRAFEATLFLYASDGQPGLSMKEAIELEALVLSTFHRAPRIQAALAGDCRSRHNDDKGRPLIDSACYRNLFVTRQQEFWSYIPGFSGFVASRPRPEQDAVFANLEAFLRKGRPPTAPFTNGDTQAFVLLPYYVEILYSRFDRNHDGLIDNSEGDLAYPVFRPFIAQKAADKGYNDPKDHEAIYNFLLATRQLPTDDAWDFAIHRYLSGPQQFTVDRAQMVEIFQKLLSL